MAASRNLEGFPFLFLVLATATICMSLPTAKTRGGDSRHGHEYGLNDGGSGRERKIDVITSNRHRRQSSDNLMAEARQYLSEEELEEFDLDDGESSERLRQVVADRQNKGANFSFGYSIQDGISDAFIERTEERSGLSVEGQYSYSDGYFMHTVSYTADDKGYRVTGMESVPVGEGPKEDEGGTALVQQVVAGVETQYAIRAKQGIEDLGREGQDEGGKTGNKYIQIEPQFQDEEQ